MSCFFVILQHIPIAFQPPSSLFEKKQPKFPTWTENYRTDQTSHVKSKLHLAALFETEMENVSIRSLPNCVASEKNIGCECFGSK